MRRGFVRVISILTVLSSVASLLCGCVSSIPSTDPENEIDFYVLNPPVNLDPQKQFYAENIKIQGMFLEGLMTRDEKGNAVCGIAKSYDVSEDGRIYTFYLREDARWDNGTEVTADDFVFAFQRLVDPENASDAAIMITEYVKVCGAEDIFYGRAPVDSLGVRAVDDHTLEIKLENPCPFFTDLLAAPTMSPCNRRYYYSHEDRYFANGDNILSCGPFTIDYYEPRGKQIHLRKNEYYYDADKVELAGVNLQLLADQQQLIMSFQTGAAECIPISGEQLEVSEGDPRLNEVSGVMVWYVMQNFNNKALANRNIRRALNLCVNREMLQKNLLRAGNTVMTRLIPEKICIEPDGTDFGGETDRYKDVCGYDPEKAREYWEKGLEELGESGAEFELLTVSETNTFMDILKEEWENKLPGFKLKYRVVQPNVFHQEMFNGNYDLCLFAWAADYGDPVSYLNLFVTGAKWDCPGFSSRVYDKIMKDANSEPLVLDAAKRFEKLHEAEDYLMEEAVIIPIYCQGSACLVSDEVPGILFLPLTPEIGFKNAKYKKQVAK